jgi:hypothetical protein
MIIPLSVNTDVYKISEATVTEVLKESLLNIKTCVHLEKILQDKEMSREDLLDDLMIFETDIRFNYLDTYVRGLCAPSDALFRRSNHSLENLRSLKGNLEEISLRFIDPSEEESKILLSVTSAIIGELTTLVYFAFSLDRTSSSLKGEGPLVYTSALQRSSDELGLSIRSIVDEVENVMLNHKTSFELYLAFPTLFDEFYEKVGALMYDFEVAKDYVTEEILVKVVSGDMEPEDAVFDLIRKMSADNA